MKRKKIPAWTVMVVCLFFMQMAADAASAQPLAFKIIAGEWARMDGNYTLRVQDVRNDGMVNVSYFNPNRIHVAESRVGTHKGQIVLFVKLVDEGYPGCTYTLYYYAEKDVLAGVYYQAAVDRTYEVVFVRKEAG